MDAQYQTTCNCCYNATPRPMVVPPSTHCTGCRHRAQHIMCAPCDQDRNLQRSDNVQAPRVTNTNAEPVRQAPPRVPRRPPVGVRHPDTTCTSNLALQCGPPTPPSSHQVQSPTGSSYSSSEEESFDVPSRQLSAEMYTGTTAGIIRGPQFVEDLIPAPSRGRRRIGIINGSSWSGSESPREPRKPRVPGPILRRMPFLIPVLDAIQDSTPVRMMSAFLSPIIHQKRKPLIPEGTEPPPPVTDGYCPGGYMAFLGIGLTSLVCWVFVMQTLPFVSRTQLNNEDWNNSVLGLFQAIEVVVLLAMLRTGSASVFGVCTAGLINAVTAVVYPVLTVGDFFGRTGKLVVLHMLCVILGGCSAMLQGSGYALAGIMPRDFVGAASAGQGLAGALTFAVVTLASFIWFDTESKLGTAQLVWTSFSIAAVTSISCTAFFYSTMQRPWAVATLYQLEVASKAKKAAETVQGTGDNAAEHVEDELEAGRGNSDVEGAAAHVSVTSDSEVPVLLAAASSASTAAVAEPGILQKRADTREDTENGNLSKNCTTDSSSSSKRTTIDSSTTPADAVPAEAGVPTDEGNESDKEAQQEAEVAEQTLQTTKKGTPCCSGFSKMCCPCLLKKKLQKQQEGDAQRDGNTNEQNETAEQNKKKRLTRCHILKKSSPWLFLLMLHMFITSHLYPKIGPLSWSYMRPLPRNHVVILFGIYSALECVGRFFPDLRMLRLRWPDFSFIRNLWERYITTAEETDRYSDEQYDSNSDGSDVQSRRRTGGLKIPFVGWMMLSRPAYVIFELARLVLFVPFILGYTKSNDPFFNNFSWYCFIMAVLALTQGWLGSLAFYYSIESVSDPEAKKFTGPLAAIASPLGCVIGLYTAVPY